MLTEYRQDVSFHSWISVWVAGKPVIPLTRAITERIRGGYDDALYKWTFTLLTLLYSKPMSLSIAVM